VGVDVGTHLDLLDLDGLLALARLGGFLLALIFELAEIGDLGNGRLGIGCYLDEIETGLFGYADSVIDGRRPQIVSFDVDELDSRDLDIPVRTRAFLDGGCRFEWSANGRVLLELFSRELWPRGILRLCRYRAESVNSTAE